MYLVGIDRNHYLHQIGKASLSTNFEQTIENRFIKFELKIYIGWKWHQGEFLRNSKTCRETLQLHAAQVFFTHAHIYIYAVRVR